MSKPFVYGAFGGAFFSGVTFLFLVFASASILLSQPASAATYSFSQNGDAFTSASGSYSTAGHCSDTCSWISGTQVIVGAYTSYYPNWGGSVTYTFDLSGVPLDSATAATLTVNWPHINGKGLHSPSQSGGGAVRVNGNTIASMATNVMQCGDWFAQNCYVYYMSFDVPVSQLSSSTSVQVEAYSQTAWDAGPVVLTVTTGGCSSGACCDTGTGNYRASGSQPAGYADFYDCDGGNSPTGTNYVRYNDYYCNGEDADAHTQTSHADTCGTCEYCESGVSTCRAYDTSTSCGTCSTCNGAGSCSTTPLDDVLCGTVGCGGWFVQTGTESATDTEYCYAKTDITSGRCEGLGDCRDSNTADCSSQPNGALQFSCGICKYIAASSCTGTTMGSCSNYASGTSCGSGNQCDGAGNCGASPTCGATDTSCGIWPTCNNCNTNDGCSGNDYRNYYCMGNSAGCGYTTDSCSDCSCTCGNYNTAEAGHCSDGKDNDCDGLTDAADPECCTSECTSGQARCSGSNRETCGNYDSDPCLEWGGSTYCAGGCSAGQCQGTGNVDIQDGKIYVGGSQFLVKGACYAPWVQGAGPDPYLQGPMPGEYDDVTASVTEGGRVYVRDYSGDGRIQTWEVIQYDLEGMKAMGANTIRTYASGVWHDKDLDGVVDTSATPERNEISQGDLPEWALDRIVSFCEDNNMMVIIGYWVQEEDFVDEDPSTAGYQLSCDAQDLAVAKDTFGRIVRRYSGSPAVLGWGIGNEVHGDWNHGWFTWTVDVNSYLNDLYAYVRSQDSSGRPIIYSPYLGESSDFNTLSADIMAPNAYTHSAADLVSLGAFSVAAPQGKAYMLGEYGHEIEEAGGHWTLAQQYAGGSFLEYAGVWWKTGETFLGAVTPGRAKTWARYSVFYKLYKGRIPGDVNGDCAVNIVDLASVGRAYGSVPGNPRWNAAADLDGSGKVGLSDLSTVGMYYGKAC